MYIYPYEYINARIEYMKYLFIHLKFEITIPIPSRAKAPAQNMACSLLWKIRKAETMRCS